MNGAALWSKKRGNLAPYRWKHKEWWIVVWSCHIQTDELLITWWLVSWAAPPRPDFCRKFAAMEFFFGQQTSPAFAFLAICCPLASELGKGYECGAKVSHAKAHMYIKKSSQADSSQAASPCGRSWWIHSGWIASVVALWMEDRAISMTTQGFIWHVSREEPDLASCRLDRG